MRERLAKLASILRRNRRWIVKRLVVYAVILIVAAPFVYLNRAYVYRTFISRYDDYVVYMDENGLPVTDYGYQAGVYVGPKITPRAVANQAANYYDMIEAGNATVTGYFNNTISWLIDHVTTINVPTENGTVEIAHWYFDFAIWDLPAGWYQAMTDAKGIRALALAYDLFHNDTYLDIIEKVTRGFEIPISLGGNLYVLDDGTYWYPEYIVPNEIWPDYKPYLVLNGFLIGLANLYMANEILNSSFIKRVFDRGVVSAAANLYKYDLPDLRWTKYHLAEPLKLAPVKYHLIHINLTDMLYKFTNVTVFRTMSDRWASYTKYPSFSWAEITSSEFISIVAFMAFIVLAPVVVIDALQLAIRRRRHGN